jgi:hypothetical protein
MSVRLEPKQWVAEFAGDSIINWAITMHVMASVEVSDKCVGQAMWEFVVGKHTGNYRVEFIIQDGVFTITNKTVKIGTAPAIAQRMQQMPFLEEESARIEDLARATISDEHLIKSGLDSTG